MAVFQILLHLSSLQNSLRYCSPFSANTIENLWFIVNYLLHQCTWFLSFNWRPTWASCCARNEILWEKNTYYTLIYWYRCSYYVIMENCLPYIGLQSFWSTLWGAVLLGVATAVDTVAVWFLLHSHHCESQSSAAFSLSCTVGLTSRQPCSWPFTWHKEFSVFIFCRWILFTINLFCFSGPMSFCRVQPNK